MSESLCVWANLDFDYELALASQGPYVPGPKLKSLKERWGSILRLVSGNEEAVLEPNSAARLLPWGVSSSVLSLPRETGQALPEPEVVRHVNSKITSHQWEVKYGCALRHARVVDNLNQLEEAVSQCSGDWVLKHPFGVGGRERVTGKHGVENPATTNWAKTRFRQGWRLVFEPWVYQRTDYSVHYQIRQSGDWDHVGECALWTDISGAFRGNRVSPVSLTDSATRSVTDRVVDEIAQLGYWGPVSFDAFCGAESRPIVEINARYTFGRLTLELARGLPADRHLLWWHAKAREVAELEERAQPYPRSGFQPGVYRLPEFADPGGATRTFVLLAESEEQLLELRTFENCSR